MKKFFLKFFIFLMEMDDLVLSQLEKLSKNVLNA